MTTYTDAAREALVEKCHCGEVCSRQRLVFADLCREILPGLISEIDSFEHDLAAALLDKEFLEGELMTALEERDGLKDDVRACLREHADRVEPWHGIVKGGS